MASDYQCQPAMNTVWSVDGNGQQQVQFGFPGPSGVSFRTMCGGALNGTMNDYQFSASKAKPSTITSYGNGMMKYDLHLQGQNGPKGSDYRSVDITGWGRVLQDENKDYAECFPRDEKVEIQLDGASSNCRHFWNGPLLPMNPGAQCDLRFWFNPDENPRFLCADGKKTDTVPLYIQEGSKPTA